MESLLINNVLNLTEVTCLSLEEASIIVSNLILAWSLIEFLAYITLFLAKLINDITEVIKVVITFDTIVNCLLISLLNIIPQFTAIVKTFAKVFVKVTVLELTTDRTLKKNLALIMVTVELTVTVRVLSKDLSILILSVEITVVAVISFPTNFLRVTVTVELLVKVLIAFLRILIVFVTVADITFLAAFIIEAVDVLVIDNNLLVRLNKVDILVDKTDRTLLYPLNIETVEVEVINAIVFVIAFLTVAVVVETTETNLPTRFTDVAVDVLKTLSTTPTAFLILASTVEVAVTACEYKVPGGSPLITATLRAESLISMSF